LFQCEKNHGGLIAVVGLILEVELQQQNSYLSQFDEPSPDRAHPTFASSGNMPSTPFIAPPLREEDADRIGGKMD